MGVHRGLQSIVFEFGRQKVKAHIGYLAKWILSLNPTQWMSIYLVLRLTLIGATIRTELSLHR